MDNSFKASILYANCLEFHYQFDDGSHSMDALVFNKCEGEIKITSYEVIFVYRYYDNDNPIETPEGRRKRQKYEADKRQLELDFKDE